MSLEISPSTSRPQPPPPPLLLDPVFHEVVKEAARSFGSVFALVFGLRTGVAVLLRIVTVIASKPMNLFNLNKLVGEKYLVVRAEAINLGLTVGGLSGGFHLISHVLNRINPFGKKEELNTFAAAFAAATSFIFFPSSSRRTVSLYLLARVAQCAYNALKKRGYWHFFGSDWAYGDALLFILSSAEIMYAYVMRPDALPSSYYKFIQRTGPIAEPVLDAVRKNNRGKQPIDMTSLAAYVKSANPAAVLSITPTPDIIPCSVLHPHNASCTRNFFQVTYDVARKIFPLYSSLTFVPLVALQYKALWRNPVTTLGQSVFNLCRSVFFLSMFTSSYQAAVCSLRKVFTHDHRLYYWIAEKKSRRSELALYTMPRALDVAYVQLRERRLLVDVPYGDILLGMTSLAALVYFYVHEPDTMASLVRIIFPFNARTLQISKELKDEAEAKRIHREQIAKKGESQSV